MTEEESEHRWFLHGSVHTWDSVCLLYLSPAPIFSIIHMHAHTNMRKILCAYSIPIARTHISLIYLHTKNSISWWLCCFLHWIFFNISSKLSYVFLIHMQLFKCCWPVFLTCSGVKLKFQYWFSKTLQVKRPLFF